MDSGLDELTDRQMEVLRSQCRGQTISQTAEEMMLSPSTVRAHLQMIYTVLFGGGRGGKRPGAKACYLLGLYDGETP